MSGSLSVLTLQEVATTLKVSEEAVLAEVYAGRLRGFRIGTEWRTTEEMISEFIRALSSPNQPAQSATLPVSMVTGKKGIPPLEQFKEMKWERLEGFTYEWPRLATDEPGKYNEVYDEAYQAAITVDGKEVPFVIGFCNRGSAGMPDRRRCVVFKGKAGQTLYPQVEFAGANDFATSGMMASVIKVDGRKSLQVSEPLPPEYVGMPVGIYDDVVIGPRSWHCLAVVAHHTDFAVMVRHAVIRLK